MAQEGAKSLVVGLPLAAAALDQHAQEAEEDHRAGAGACNIRHVNTHTIQTRTTYPFIHLPLSTVTDGKSSSIADLLP